LERIAIIRLSSLGDIVHALPAFQQLRLHFPAARITWIAEAPGAALLENFSGIDDIVTFDLKSRRGWFARACYLVRFVSRHRRRFDLLIDFQGLLKSALLAWLLGKPRLGFCRGNVRESMAALFYSRRADFFPEDRHVIFKNLHLLSVLDIDDTEVRYPPMKNPPSRRLEQWLAELGWPDRGYVILNVGGGWPTKLLAAAQWQEIAAALRTDHPLVVLWGNEREKDLAATVARLGGGVLADFMDFTDLIHFIARARLVISGDTLALHLADLTRTPALGIFGPTSPRRNGSLLPQSRAFVRQLPCSFCYRRQCDTMACLQGIAIRDIVDAARKINEQIDGKAD
jgi:lipopolysaccharide heptosyltransferase I